MVPPDSDKVSRVSSYSGYCQLNQIFAYGAFTLYGRPSQGLSTNLHECIMQSYNPALPESNTVWAIPPSLAATKGISLDFFSSGYLDGSVPRVSPYIAMYSLYNNRHLVYWVTPFGNPRVKRCLLLTEAYRSLPRPSSPDGSKASTMDP